MKLNLRRLKAERVASGYSQEEIAKQMGWKNRLSYTMRENGKTKITADELVKLAGMYGYSKDELGIFFIEDTENK